ncbi:MAG TPA: S9 family peptidase [Acidimicrobiales bacterium]|nr:S9 family peptidase [Acidimicrobiales bacterium]
MARPLTAADVARLPLPGMSFPTGIAYSHDERLICYVHSPDGTLEQRLFLLEVDPRPSGGAAGHHPVEVRIAGAATSEAELSPDERLRRERLRDVRLGVTSASWARNAGALLVPLPDGLRVVTGLGAEGARVVVALEQADVRAPILGARLSPDGGSIAFVSGGDLHVVDAAGGSTPLRLTSTAEEGLTNGLAEYVAQEEMSRSEGLWWSPDSSLIAYTEVDERHIPLYRIAHPGSDVGAAAEETHRYPFTGGPNAIVRLGVLPAAGGETLWLDTGDPDRYLARVVFLDDGRLVAEVQSRDQTLLEVAAFDPRNGARELLFTERGEPWVELHDDFRALADGTYLWSSERSGHRHLERRSPDGELLAVLTSGDWQVDALEAVDEEAGVVYFSGRADGPVERHLYRVPLAGGEPERLTPERGWHVCVVGPKSGTFVDRHGSLDTPPTVRLRSLAGASVLVTLHDRRDPRIDELGIEPPELVDIPAADGTILHALYFRPDPAYLRPDGAVDEGAPPLAVEVYGGPHAQRAVDDWISTVRLRAQALRRRGAGVLVLDNRGSAGRGIGFVRPLHHRFGDIEVADQVQGVRWAVERGLADAERVAVYGSSYGGYMSLRLLGAAPEIFRAAVAGAPVTSFYGYDTHYTERYLGTPQSDPAAYERASVFGLVPSMRGELLLVHGLIDENVHFRHTARLINRLIEQRKPYELLVFPNERHLPRAQADRTFLEERVLAFLERALTG